MSGVQSITVSDSEAGMRLDRWFGVHFPALRHSRLEKLLRTGQIRVNGGRVKASRRLEAGEVIRIPPLDDDAAAKRETKRYDADDAKEIRRLILYEDDAVIALNKPFGLAVQGGTNTKRHIDGMLLTLEKNGERPRLVHRLDKDTGGLLLLAKTRQAAQRLGDAFKRHDVEKTYWALTAGAPTPREGTISLAIGKENVGEGAAVQEKVVSSSGARAKKSVTDYQMLDQAGPVAFLAMRPITGRTHQLRVHAAAIGCPIVGDGKYGGAASKIDGVSSKLHLFCRTMTFPHPKTGKRATLTAPLTGHMAKTWDFFGFDREAACIWPDDLR